MKTEIRITRTSKPRKAKADKPAGKRGRPRKNPATVPAKSRLQQAYEINRNWEHASQKAWDEWEGSENLKKRIFLDNLGNDEVVENVGVLPVCPSLKRVVDYTVREMPAQVADLCLKELDSEIEIDALRFPGFDRKTLLLLNALGHFISWLNNSFSPALFISLAIRLQACEDAGLDIYSIDMLEKHGPLVYENSERRKEALAQRAPLAAIAGLMAKLGGARHDN